MQVFKLAVKNDFHSAQIRLCIKLGRILAQPDFGHLERLLPADLPEQGHEVPGALMSLHFAHGELPVEVEQALAVDALFAKRGRLVRQVRVTLDFLYLPCNHF